MADTNKYYNIEISRSQAQKICFAILPEILVYCDEHNSDFQEYVRAMELKEKETPKTPKTKNLKTGKGV